MQNNPFIKPNKPKNSLQMISWVINEFSLLDKYAQGLSKKETILTILKVYLSIIIPLSILLFLTSLVVIVFFDFPLLYPEQYDVTFLEQWQQNHSILQKYIFLLTRKIVLFPMILVFFLVLGLMIGLVNGLVMDSGKGLGGLPYVIVFGLGSGLLFGLGSGITSGIALSFVLGLGSGLVISLASGFFINLASSLVFILGSCLVIGLIIGLVFGLLNSLVFGVSFIFTSYRLYSYPYYLFKVSKTTLTDNPYIETEAIFFPLLLVDSKLTTLAKQNPSIGVKFSNFIYKYRRFNLNLGSKIRHSLLSGFMLNYPLDANSLIDLKIAKDTPKYLPSKQWYSLIDEIQKQIVNYEKQTHISLKKASFEEVIVLLGKFKEQNLVESSLWNHFYFDAIDKWIEEADKKLKIIEIEQKDIEPIQKNIYRYGLPLMPGKDDDIFLGREDIKDELSIKIQTSDSMPALMLQGQRRVGKSSLINYLPQLLGSRYKVVSFDCQGLEDREFSTFLKQLQKNIDKVLGLESDIFFSGDWVKDWNAFEAYLRSITLEQNIKLLIVLDEYESIHEQIFIQKKDEAGFILGKIRSFLQSQNDIGFIFVGLFTFSDMKEPNWNEYFVHYERIKIKYLDEVNSLKLIKNPVEDFRLKYPEDVAQKIYKTTDGHPALIQLICKDIVDVANRDNISDITMKIVDKAIEKIATDKELYPIQIFWTQFCGDEERACIQEILLDKKITNKKSLARLEDYDFVVDGKIRVPIFKMWLEKFHDRI